MGYLVKLVGSGIGLASEAIAARKQGSSSDPSRNRRDAYYDMVDDRPDQRIPRGRIVPVVEQRGYQDERREPHKEEYDGSAEGADEDSEPNDAVDAALDVYDRQTDNYSRPPPKVLHKFLADHPKPSPGIRLQRLPCPIILPQRRPHDSKRGFVRAYAPVLADADVDETSFLQFLKLFQSESKSSPYLYAINGAAMVAGFAPSAIAQITSIVVSVAAGAAMEVQHRYRTNSFLDQVNEGYFKPRGLYALIMTYKPESRDTFAFVDINKSISGSMGPKTFKQNMKMSAGTTYSQLELPEAAPLVYPALEDPTVESQSKGSSSGMKSKQKFMADYFDRRAQATFAAENPGSSLTTPGRQQFASRYADPNHAANNGSLISLLTGGSIASRQGSSPTQLATQFGSGTRGEQGGPIRRMLKKDVLYLMVVNLPTEADKMSAEAAGLQIPGAELGNRSPRAGLEAPARYARSSQSRSSENPTASTDPNLH